MNKIIFGLMMLGVVFTGSAYAQSGGDQSEPVENPHGLYKEIGTSGDWTAIQFEATGELDGKSEKRLICAIFSRPKDSKVLEDGEEIAALRGERAAFITWEQGRVDENGGVFSAIVGAPLSDDFGDHHFETEHGRFEMFGYHDRLFAKEETDRKGIDAIRRGLELVLTAELPGGRQARDVYSLSGVMKATELAASTCGRM